MFKEWLINEHKDSNNVCGDLARDVEQDKKFPETDNLDAMLTHIVLSGGCSQAVTALEICYHDYRTLNKEH